FMLHFGFIGAMYSDWSDQVVTDDVTVQGLADLLNNVPTPIAEVQPEDQTPTTPTNTTPTQAPTHATTNASNTSNAQPGHMTDHAALALNNRAESMMIDLVGAMNSTTSMDGAMRRSEYPISDLSQVANSPYGTSPGSDLTLAPGSVAVMPGSHHSLTDLGTAHLDPTHKAVVVDAKPPPTGFT
ncbi:hypothetical protein, partial [Escherichia coli]|uniref:hypothetical protein n=1 Tax=Escherichia coli TaxID=562 RepID=UPI000B15498D